MSSTIISMPWENAEHPVIIVFLTADWYGAPVSAEVAFKRERARLDKLSIDTHHTLRDTSNGASFSYSTFVGSRKELINKAINPVPSIMYRVTPENAHPDTIVPVKGKKK